MDTLKTGPSALIDALSIEHGDLMPGLRRVMRLADAGDAALAAAVAELAGRVGDSLDRHIAYEDETLFPRYAAASGDGGLVDQFVREHRDIQRLRDELLAARARGADPRHLAAAALGFADLLAGHIEREDMMLFPTIRAALE